MLERILILLKQYRSAALHLNGLIRKYRRFRVRSMNKNKEFTPEATKLVLGELQLNGADMHLRLVKNSRPTNNQLPHHLPNTKPSSIQSPRYQQRPRVNIMDVDFSEEDDDIILSPSDGEEETQQDPNDQHSSLDIGNEQPLVNTMQNGGPCEICADADHPTIKCPEFHWLNKDEGKRRRINQARLLYKKEYTNLQKQSKSASYSSKHEAPGNRPPIPPRAHTPPLAQPKISTISSEMSSQFHKEAGPPQCMFDELYHEPYVMSVQEEENVKDLESIISSAVNDMLVSSSNDHAEPMTPIVANVMTNDQSSSHASAHESGLLVEFDEPTNLVPVQAEFDEPLIPSDYDAYGGYAGIADSSSTAVNW